MLDKKYVPLHTYMNTRVVLLVCVVRLCREDGGSRDYTNFELAVYLSAADDDDDANQIKGFRFQTHSDHTTPRYHARVANNNDTQ